MRILGFFCLGAVGSGVGKIDGLSLLKEGNVLGRAEGSEDGDSLLIDGASEGIDVGDIDGLSLLKEGNTLGLKLGSGDGG